jgi:hypothetical protein
MQFPCWACIWAEPLYHIILEWRNFGVHYLLYNLQSLYTIKNMNYRFINCYIPSPIRYNCPLASNIGTENVQEMQLYYHVLILALFLEVFWKPKVTLLNQWQVRT